jgi:pimeloyl-ACP methyl ester carboxylesterase
MRNFTLVLFIFLALLGRISIMPVLGQDAATYTDPQGQFTVTIPARWVDKSTPEYGLFTNDGFEFYFLSIPDSDVQAAAASAISQISPLFEGVVPNPMGQVPSPSGIWTQAMYTLPDDTLAITVAQSNSEATIILVTHMANMGQLQALSADVQSIIASVEIVGVTPATPEVAPATASALPSAQGNITLPEPTGPYMVGRTSYHWTDEARLETYTSQEADKRSLSVWVWYPAAETVFESAPYLTKGMNALFQPLLGLDAAQIGVHAHADTTAAVEDAPYPVLVFSPGNGLNSVLYTALLEEIASHGYIVVGIDHSYNALFTTLPDGQVVGGVPEAAGQSENDFQIRIADVQFVMDQLVMLNADQESPLVGKLDLGRLALFGHSFGGATAAEVCRIDARCKAVLVMDSPLQGAVATEGLPQPIMLMDSERVPGKEFIKEAEQLSGQTIPEGQADVIDQFNIFRDETAVLVGEVSSTLYHLFIAGTRHGSFSDIPFMAQIQPSVQLYMGGLANIDAERGWQIISDYALAFFDRHVQNGASPLLQAASDVYPEVQISVTSH